MKKKGAGQRKITSMKDEVYVDNDSGEVLAKREETTYLLDKEPPFVKLYLDNVLFLTDLPKWLNTTLMALLERMPYTGKGFAVNGAVRREIAKETNTTEGSVRNAITKLSQGKLLLRIDTGYYQFNPYFFGKGEWKDIERLRLEIIYDCSGRTFLTEIKHFEENQKRQRQLAGQMTLESEEVVDEQ